MKKLNLMLPLLMVWGCTPTDEGLALSGETMGTSYAVNITRIPSGSSRGAIQNAIDTELSAVNSVASTYDNSSEISRFNRQKTTDWMPATPSLHELLETALNISEMSGGAFDITAAPLINAWGFGPNGRQAERPDQKTIQALLGHVDYRKIKLRGPPYEVRKLDSQVTIDLSAIAKGYGVDRIAAKLIGLGVEDFLIEIGGEIRAQGTRDDRNPWRIGVEKPVAGERAVERVIALTHAAIATSGDYRNFYTLDGRRYSHVIDPRTGNPVRHELALVSVIADSAMTADAWATALLALGPEDGYSLAHANGIAALFTVRNGPEFTERTTPAFNTAADGL
jgi:thiamine biosynthesis lipoprotein